MSQAADPFTAPLGINPTEITANLTLWPLCSGASRLRGDPKQTLTSQGSPGRGWVRREGTISTAPEAPGRVYTLLGTGVLQGL